MSKLPGNILVLALVAVGSFIAGRASGGVDDEKLRAELALWKRDAAGAIRERDSSRLVIVALRDAFAATEASMNRLLNRAAVKEAQADRHNRTADSLLADLARALTPSDSNAILVRACTERALECASLRSANVDLRFAVDTSNAGKQTLRDEIAVHVQQRERDSTRAMKADSLVRVLEKAARGCRIFGLSCPEGLLGYGWDDKSFRVGGLVPVKLPVLGRVNLSVTTRIGGVQRQP